MAFFGTSLRFFCVKAKPACKNVVSIAQQWPVCKHSKANRLFYLRKKRMLGLFFTNRRMKKEPPEIRILTDDVANKIAAGEVIERPAAVAKELLENAIDAGAKRVEIEIKHGGKSFVKVLDDGCGMTRQQALMSLEPHATSKIRVPEDLFNISSYGFRGEAVPSIASVSRFKMRTKPEEQKFGTEIDVYAGEVNSVRDCGMADGTEITVENLFCSVPARRKFLKSDNVEASHIVRLCRLYALALPYLSLTLVENSRVVFRSESNLKIIDRIERIFGSEISSKLVELKPVSLGRMSLEGAILRAGESFPTGRNICSFINGRPVECKAVYSAVKEAYSQYVPKGRFAAAFLFLKVDPNDVDVNVHPAKREVRLKNDFQVRDFILESLVSALEKSQANTTSFSDKNGAKISELFPKREEKPAVPVPLFTPRDTWRSANTGIVNPVLSEFQKADSNRNLKEASAEVRQVGAFADSPQSRDIQSDGDPNCAGAGGCVAEGKSPKEVLAESWRYVGCLKKRFALFETAKGLVIMSISSALKRVRYEMIMRDLQSQNALSQNLLIPISIKFERGDDECFFANRKAFESCGFVIEDFGKSFYRITGAPVWLKYGEIENFVRDFVEIAREENRILRKSKLSDENFANMLVRRYGAANFSCTETSAMELLAQLLSGASGASSPDGRPTMKEISDSELARMFQMV